MEGVADRAKKIRVETGTDPESDMGPLVSKEQFDRVCGYLEWASPKAPRRFTGGKRAGEKGYFVEPTVLVNAPETPGCPGGNFRPRGNCNAVHRPGRIASARTAPYTVWPQASGPQTSAKRTGSQRNCAPAPCGSTATTSSTRRSRSGAISNRDGAVKWARKRWNCIPRRSRSACAYNARSPLASASERDAIGV